MLAILSKRVVFLRSNPVAPDPRVEKEALALAKHGYDVSIVCWDRKKEFPEKDDYRGIPITRLQVSGQYGGGMKNFGKVLSWNLALLSWLNKNRHNYDIIHACDFDTVIPAIIVKFFCRKKVVYDIFDFYADMVLNLPRWMRGIIRFFDSCIVGKADAVIICDDARREQIKGFHPRKLVVIYNSVPEIENLVIPGRDCCKGLKVGYAGNLAPDRGIFALINVVKKMPQVHLDIAGTGKLKDDVLRAVRGVGNIKFYGTIPVRDAIALHASSDVVYAVYDPSIPNNRYASANKLFEAIAFGKPVIVARNTKMDELVKKYNLGFVVDYGNEQQLIEVFNCLLAMGPDERKNAYRHNADIYRELFAWDKMEQRLIDLYENI